LGTNLEVGGSKFGFLGEKWCKNRNRGKLAISEICLEHVCYQPEFRYQRNCTVTAFPVSRSCIFFTHFRFELVFGVNMKVLDN